MLCWNTIKDTCQSWPTLFRAKRPFCRRYRMICFTSSLITQLYRFATNFVHVLQLVGIDIVNTLLKYRVSLRYLTLLIETFERLMKSCAKFDLLFVNIQCGTVCSLWVLKFKVLYMSNHSSYFNKIRTISCVNILVQNLKVLLKSIPPWPNCSIFMGLFFIGALCRPQLYEKSHLKIKRLLIGKWPFNVGSEVCWCATCHFLEICTRSCRLVHCVKVFVLLKNIYQCFWCDIFDESSFNFLAICLCDHINDIKHCIRMTFSLFFSLNLLLKTLQPFTVYVKSAIPFIDFNL